MVVKELVARLGLDIDQSAFALGDTAINGLKTNLFRVGAILSGVAVGLTAAAVATSNYGSEIDDLHKSTGISRQSLQELKYMAGQTGLEFGQLVQGIRLMNRTAGEAAQGSKEAQEAFRQIGIEPSQFKTQDAMFGAIGDRIKALKDSGQDVKAQNVARDIFGKGGPELITLLGEGADGMQKFRDRVHELGIMTDEEIIRSEAFGDKLADLRWRLQHLVHMIGGPVIEAFLWFGESSWRVAGAIVGLSSIIVAVAYPAFLGLMAQVIALYTVYLPGLMMALAFTAGQVWALAATAIPRLLQGMLMLIWRFRVAAFQLWGTAAATMWTGWTFKGLATSVWNAVKAMVVWIATNAQAGWTALVGAVTGAIAAFSGLSLATMGAGLMARWAAIQAAVAWVAGLWPIFLMIAVIAVLIAMVQDVWGAFNGGKSVFGELFKMLKTLGMEAINYLKEQFLGLWASVKTGFKDAITSVKGFFGFGDAAPVGDFNQNFGGGANPTASSESGKGTGGRAGGEFKSNVAIYTQPGQSPAAIGAEVVGQQRDWQTDIVQEAQAQI